MRHHTKLVFNGKPSASPDDNGKDIEEKGGVNKFYHLIII